MLTIKSVTPIMKYEKLKIQNHFQEMITATVSHEMRTPLNAINGLLQSISLFVSSEQGKKLIKIVENSSKLLLFLVNDLLDYSQIKNGKFKKNEQPTDIRQAVTDLLDILRLAIEEKGLQLIFHCHDNVPQICVVDI